MKCTVIIDKSGQEEIIIRCKKRTPTVDKIERLIGNDDERLIGFKDGEANVIDINDVYCFIVQNNKVFAVLENEMLLLKQRLYIIEERSGPEFIKINQSCLANIDKIRKFDMTVAGALKVVFKNGYVDYVSRRNLKAIKERLGL